MPKAKHATAPVASLDTLTLAERSERMGRVRSKDTRPELRVRQLVHALGYRYRLHRRDLPGCPDLVFVARRKVIFVHGCFWHRHPGCARSRFPKSPERSDFWKAKLLGNVQRDRQCLRALARVGWAALVVWECESEDAPRLEQKIRSFLE